MAPGLSEADLVSFYSGQLPEGQLCELQVNEARFGLSRLLPVLSSLGRESRVLEVGAGTCILSAYLASKGLRVTALEPLGPEFDFMAELQARVVDLCRSRGIALEMLRKTGEQLDLENRFDVAFTINALEHMSDPLLVIDNMYRALAPGGVLLGHCPNYTVPLEVHFNILLITRSKRINEWFYRRKIQKFPQVWQKLNFIRQIDLRRHLQWRSLSFTFNTSVFRDAVRRLMDDPIFAQRMPMPMRAIGRMQCATGGVHALGLVPAGLQTPMEVLVRKRQS